MITYWSTSSPSFLLGGITYSNGALTVPSDGIYYIYTHLWVGLNSGPITPTIRVNGNIKLYLKRYHTGSESESKHGALMQQLRKGDRVHIYGGGRQHYMAPQHTAFGIFKIHY